MQGMKNISARSAAFRRKALSVAAAALFGQAVLANPLGPSVASGSATFNTHGSTLTVTNTPGTIINWQQFNINQGETTRFVQQSASSAVLNRIGGQNASQIFGTLQSNGRVFLVNPNGVMIGQGAVVDVAGLTLSSLNLSDANFLANKLQFEGGGFGAVTNLGTISTPLGGSVFLIGSNVTNQGVITSPQGQVVLAAGNSVSLIDSGGPELSVTINATSNKAVNLGTVTANGGRIDMFGALIEQAGVLRADSASVDASGNIVLKATQSTTVSGDISANNSAGQGGSIQILGDQVSLTSTAKVGASGTAGGGTVLIGGDYKGENPAIQNARQTTIAAGATINADALDNGNGGRVIVWANDKTFYDGFISARGGANGGDGGFVETSGKNGLSITTGQVDTRAPYGSWGTWLLDPDRLCIQGFSSCSVFSAYGSSPDAVINWTTIASNLNTNGQVDLTATSIISLEYINWTAPTSFGPHTSLRLTAPAIYMGDVYLDFRPANNYSGRFDLSVEATGSPVTSNFNSVSGVLKLFSTSLYTHQGFHEFLASSELRLDGMTIKTWDDVDLASPYLNIQSTASVDAFWMGIAANKITGQFSSGSLDEIGIVPYSPNFNVYLGRSNTDPSCGTTGLCITNQFNNISADWAEVGSGISGSWDDFDDVTDANLSLFSGDIVVTSGSWSVPSNQGMDFFARNVTIEPGASISRTGSTPETYPIGVIATNTFKNLGNGINTNGYGNWLVAVGNYAESVFGSMATGARVLTASDIIATLENDSYLSWTGNIIFDFGFSSSNDVFCRSNPTACGTSYVPEYLDYDQPFRTDYYIFDDKAQGDLTFSANLKIASKDEKKDDKKEGEKDGRDKDKQKGKDDAKATKDRKSAVAQAREDARAADEKKSPGQLKNEAKNLRDEAKKVETDAKRVETEAKRGEGEARRVEGEAKRVETEARRVEGQAKKAEEGVKKAEADARKHDADARQAEKEANEAPTPQQKFAALTRKANAESRKAEAEARKAEGEARKSEADGKKAEAQTLKAEAEVRKTEADSRKADADSRKADADSKKAEADAKLALAEVKEARTPQQKQAAEKRVEEKRAEADQKRVESEQKRGEAEVKKGKAETGQVEREAKKADHDAKKADQDAKKADHDAKKADQDAKKAESEARKAEQDAQKARQEGKQAEAKKADERKAEQEKKANEKKQEAEQKKAEHEKKQKEAEQKKADADRKQAEAERKKGEERRQAVQAFGKAQVAALGNERMAQILAMRREHKNEIFQPALNILKANPRAADLPGCGAGGDVCVPERGAVDQAVQGLLPPPRVPTMAFLPQIERKVALVLAIGNYQDQVIPSLASPGPDGEAVAKLMQENLGYDVRLVKDAGKGDIVRAIRELSRQVGPKDSVTIYYAGHGYQSTTETGAPGEGYWMPADASVRNPSNWLSNSDITKLLATIPARQVMLVSDSCYSGSLTREQRVATQAGFNPADILAKRSVVVMSSGGEEPVADEGKDGHSIFAWSFMNTLRDMDKFDAGNNLYDNVRKGVVGEFPQVPQYGASATAGHVRGGDYLFEVRRY